MADLVDVVAEDYAQALDFLREDLYSVLVAFVFDDQVLFGLLHQGKLIVKC
jgi:hypothetical protein